MEALETMCKCFEILVRVQVDYDAYASSKELDNAIKKLEKDISTIILSSNLEISH